MRPALVSDAARLAGVHVASWRAAYEGILPAAFLDGLDREGRERWFRDRIPAGGIYVSGEDDAPVGYCWVGRSSSPGWGEVYAVYVHPASWGRGHGQALMSAAEGELKHRGFDHALLWVLEQNRHARAFYEHLGWARGRPIRIEEIAGVQVTESRYEKSLRSDA